MAFTIGNYTDQTLYDSNVHYSTSYAHTVAANSKFLLSWIYAGGDFGGIDTYTYDSVPMVHEGTYENIHLYSMQDPPVGTHNIHYDWGWPNDRKAWSWTVDITRPSYSKPIYNSEQYKASSVQICDRNVSAVPAGLLVGWFIKDHTDWNDLGPGAGETVLFSRSTSLDGIYYGKAYYKQVTGLSSPGTAQTKWTWNTNHNCILYAVLLEPKVARPKVMVFF